MLLGGTVERTKFILLSTKLKFNKLFHPNKFFEHHIFLIFLDFFIPA